MLSTAHTGDSDASEFIPVSNRAKKRRKNQPYRASECLSLKDQVERARSTLSSRRKALEEDAEWYSALTGQIMQIGQLLQPVFTHKHTEDGTSRSDSSEVPSESPVKILCLGLGKISESREAQVQYVLLQDLVTDLRIQPSQVELFDPMFTPVDVELIRQDGYMLLPENKCGAHVLDPDIPTLAYLPHCPRDLYEAFLRTNWDRESFVPIKQDDADTCEAGSAPGDQVDTSALANEQSDQAYGTECRQHDNPGRKGRCVLLANDFKDYCVSVPSKKLQDESPCIARIAPHLVAKALVPLSTNHLAHNAFSSLCYQYLDTGSLGKIDWSSPPRRQVGHDGENGEMVDGRIGGIFSTGVVTAGMANIRL